MNFNLQRTRNVRTPQFSHFSTGAKVPCWNKCEIVPVAAVDLFLIGNDRKFFFYPRRKGWLKNSHSSFEVLWMWLYADVCISSISNVTHMAESNTWSTVRLPLISVEGPRVIKDRCILLVIDISTFYKHSALVIKYFSWYENSF